MERTLSSAGQCKWETITSCHQRRTEHRKYQCKDTICNYDWYLAELGGYFRETSFEEAVRNSNLPLTFYDCNSGKPLFQAPIGISKEDFLAESNIHGWPSFRDQETVWDNVRVLKGSFETVSVDGTHLGHNLPDKQGNRY